MTDVTQAPAPSPNLADPAGSAVTGEPTPPDRHRVPTWALVVAVVALIAALLAVLGYSGRELLPVQAGPPEESLVVERTILKPNTIELGLRNVGSAPVTVAQIFVNDQYVDFDTTREEIGRSRAATIIASYPWQDGSPYNVAMVTSSGAVIEHEIPAAVETPDRNGSTFTVMALLGLYVGIIPVVLGMLFLPVMRRAGRQWMPVLMAFTVGLLVLLAVDGTLEGLEIADTTGGAFGGTALLALGAILAWLALTGVEAWVGGKEAKVRGTETDIEARGPRLALLVSIGIGLHNLAEGLAIGAAFAIGELALGTFLVLGFAIQNTTEGIAIVAPLSHLKGGVTLRRLLLYGVIAGTPAILGALIGSSISNPSLSTLLIGLGVGAVVQVIGQIAPYIRDASGRMFTPQTATAMAAGALLLYGTGLIVPA